MKKKSFRMFLVLLLIFTLFFTLSFSSYAGTATRSGQTAGGTVGILYTSAQLDVASSYARATTSVGISVTCTTAVTFYYVLNNIIASVGGTGTTSAYATPNRDTGVSGASSHSVNGGSAFGSWTTSLTTNY